MGASLLAGTAVKAEQVQFITTGIFSGGDAPGSSTYSDAANGVSIIFNNSLDNTVNPPPTSQVSFGTFDTSGTTATDFSGILGTFTLTITQVSGSGGQLDFSSTLNGTIRFDNSQAYIQFDGPLTQSLGNVFYQIASADDGVAGRVNLGAPTTGNGLASITGRVGITAIPEPASLTMLSLGSVSMLVMMGRRKLSNS
ncbi:hypothetical protein EP7_001593 [Isosphaeraceae bacterium EP7]